MKAVLHHGEAVFTQIRQFNKLSGEDVILAHRLLKVPIENKEHVLVTESMHMLIGDLDGTAPEVRTEDLGELGHVRINVYYASNDSRVLASRASVLTKLRMLGKVEWHSSKRLVVPASKRYQNLEASQLK